MKHTELPWRVNDSGFLVGNGAEFPDEGAMEPKIAVFMNDDDVPSEYMGNEERDANRKYVELACNYHHKLYEALANVVFNPTEFNIDNAAGILQELDNEKH